MSCRPRPRKSTRKSSSYCGSRRCVDSSDSSSSESSYSSVFSDSCDCSGCDCYSTPQKRRGKGKSRKRNARATKSKRGSCGPKAPRKKTARRGSRRSYSDTDSDSDSSESYSSDGGCCSYNSTSKQRRKTKA